MATDEKKYNEALERAREIKEKIMYSHLSTESCKAVSEYIDIIIPELAESEDERIRKWIVKFVTEQYPECWKDKKNKMLAYLEKQKEQKPLKVGENAYFDPNTDMWFIKEDQKPTESISQLTVQGKGVYKICPRCKERMVRDDSMVYTSMPPQYRYECPKCGESECDTVMYDNPEMKEQKPKAKAKSPLSPHELYDAKIEGISQGRQDVLDHPEQFGLQKPAEWSEKDELMISHICSLIQHISKTEDCREIAWLKSLPERFNLQPKQEWSDEEMDVDIREEIKKLEFMGSNDARDILHVAEHFYKLGLKAK